jgi:hypothetical protein
MEARDMRHDEEAEIKVVLAQLRHAYDHLVNGTAKHPQQMANGLIGPQIARLERLITPGQPVPPVTVRLPRFKRLARPIFGRKIV